MKVVMIALQRLSANGICAKAVLNEFVKRGHDVTWVCNAENDDAVEIEGMEIIQVKPRWADSALARYSSNPALTQMIKMLNRVGMIRSLFTWPLISRSYAKRVVKAAVSATEDADVVIGAYTQIDALIAAHEAKCVKPGIRYVAWFLDSFTGGHGPRFMSAGQIEKRGRRWNRLLLDTADVIVAMESSRTFHESHNREESWYERLRFLDIPLLVDTGSDFMPSEKTGVKSEVTIAYAGSLPSGIRSPRFILDAIKEVENDRIRLVFIGDSTNLDLLEAQKKDPRIVVKGRLSHDEVVEELEAADFLLSLGNTLTNMTPSKIFEYMALRKPIIATYPIDNEPSIAYLKRYKNALLLDERSSPKEAAVKIQSFISQPYDPISSKRLESEFWKNTPMALCKLIENEGD